MTMTDAIRQQLREALQPGDAAANEWLREACEAVRAHGVERLRPAFAEAARRVGRGALAEHDPDGGVRLTLQLDRFAVPLATWRRADAARAVLLLELAARDGTSDHALRVAADRYFAGDAQERVSLLRCFALLPGARLAEPPADAPSMDTTGDDARTVALRATLDACRHSHVALFDAATAGNAFFSAVAPELEFNKAVLKRVFLDLPLGAVLELGARANADLSRMLFNLMEEREISFRPWPREILPVVARKPPATFLARLVGFISHPDDLLRAAAAESLRVWPDATARERCRPFVAEQRARESQAHVRDALDRLLAN